MWMTSGVWPGAELATGGMFRGSGTRLVVGALAIVGGGACGGA